MKGKWILIAFIVFVAFSCEKKNRFFIDGKVEGIDSGQIIFLNLHDNLLIDTVKISKGVFRYTGRVTEPTPLLLFAPDILPAQTIVYVEKGKTKINFQAGTPESLHVEGGKTQMEYENFFNSTKSILQSLDSILMLQYTGGESVNPEDIQNAQLALQIEYEKKQQDFIRKNPDSYVSPFLASMLIQEKKDLPAEEKQAIFDGLSKEMQSSFYGKKIVEFLKSEENTAIGSMAPEIVMNDPKGKEMKLSDLKGQYVLLDFWASWCGPCLQENPNVLKAYNLYKDKNFTILGVSLDERKDAWVGAIQNQGLGWHHISDLKGWNSAAVPLYNIQGIPMNFLLDPDGKIIAKNLRGEELIKTLATTIK